MKHLAVDQVLLRAEKAKGDADFTYFFSVLLATEALAKAVVVGIVAAIGDDKDRNRYRLEHQLVRADGIGDWGKALEDYRVSAITADVGPFDFLKKDSSHTFSNGVYLFAGKPRRVPLVDSDPELLDFFFANGGFNGKRFELLSYYSDNKLDGDATSYITPPGTLPPSETQGSGELVVKGNCFSNAPELSTDYVGRIRRETTRRKVWLSILRISTVRTWSCA